MSALSAVKRIFPPPRYITLPNVGVDVSDSSVKYVQFARESGDSLGIERWGSVDVPSGVVESGDILDVPTLGQVLAEVKEEISTPYVRLSLPEERAYIFETAIGISTPMKEVRGLLEFKLEENVPIPPREAIFDYGLVERDEEAELLRIAVTVYGKEVINAYKEACVLAGLMPLSFEVEAQAIARAVVREGLTGAYLIVDFGQTRTGIGIVYRNTLMYTSTIEVGGNALSRVLREHLGDLPEEELTQFKNTRGIQNVAGEEDLHADLVAVIDGIKDEIRTRIQYWHTLDIDRDKRGIESVILCGGSSNLAGFADYLRRELSVSVEHGRVWQNAFSLEDVVPPITKRYSYSYATAVGLGITDFVHHL